MGARADKPVAHAPTVAEAGRQADPAQEDLDAGWEMIRVANWPAAAEALETAESKAVADEVRAEALFALAHVWHHRQPASDLAKARGLYGRILAEFPDTLAAPWAKLTVARMVDTPEKEPRTEQAAEAIREEARRRYRRILADHPRHLVAHEAALRLGVSYLTQRGSLEAERIGAEILIDYLAAHPGNYLAAQMHILAGEWHQRNGREREAVEAFIAAYEAGLPSMLHKAKTSFRIAQIAEFRLEDYALAAQWYERLLIEAPQDNRHYLSVLGAERCRARLSESGRPAEQAKAGAR